MTYIKIRSMETAILPSHRVVEKASAYIRVPFSQTFEPGGMAYAKKTIITHAIRQAYDWIAEQKNPIDYMVGVPVVEEDRDTFDGSVYLRTAVDIYVQEDVTILNDTHSAQPEPQYGAYVLKRNKKGVPTKVQILDKEYALIPPPVGKGGRK